MHEKKILNKIKTELENYTNLKFNFENTEEDEYKFIDGTGEVVVYVDLGFFKDFNELIVDFELNKIRKNFKFPFIMLKDINKNCPDIDRSHSFNDLSIDEIKNKYKYEEYVHEIRKTYYEKITMKFNSNVELVEIKREDKRNSDVTIDNEGGRDIKFYIKDGKYFERKTDRELKGLLDIGGQNCSRLIPILL